MILKTDLLERKLYVTAVNIKSLFSLYNKVTSCKQELGDVFTEFRQTVFVIKFVNVRPATVIESLLLKLPPALDK